MERGDHLLTGKGVLIYNRRNDHLSEIKCLSEPGNAKAAPLTSGETYENYPEVSDCWNL